MTIFSLQQAAASPPVPPHEVTVGGSLEGWDAVILIAAVMIRSGCSSGLDPGDRPRIEAGAAVAEARGELDELRDRIRHLEEASPRLVEMEERLDFAERLLAQQEPDRVKR